jgi:hypothetical protein
MHSTGIVNFTEVGFTLFSVAGLFSAGWRIAEITVFRNYFNYRPKDLQYEVGSSLTQYSGDSGDSSDPKGLKQRLTGSSGEKTFFDDVYVNAVLNSLLCVCMML